MLDEKKSCPFLTADNWCSIQRKYGEEFLSVTCVTYPRRTWSFTDKDASDFYERALTMTCPSVAMAVLVMPEPLKFGWVEVPEKIHSNIDRIRAGLPPTPVELWKYLVDIQTTAISILQQRALTIDQRLIVLGFFLDRLDELVELNQLEEIEKLAAIYKSPDFVRKNAPLFAQGVEFKPKEHMEIMFGTFKALYAGRANVKDAEQKFLYAVFGMLKLTESFDADKNVSIEALANHYAEVSDFRKNFVPYFSTVFENYLVNEFFMNLYPWTFKGSVPFNYGVFLTIYKLLELIILSLAFDTFKRSQSVNKMDLVAAVMSFATNIDHNKSYVDKIAEHLKGKEDTLAMLESLLQG